MRYVLISICVIFLLIFIWSIPNIYRTHINVQNSKEIKLGMDKMEVLRIMGPPDARRISYFNEIDSLYYYQPPFGASSGIEIIFDRNENVKQILHYE